MIGVGLLRKYGLLILIAALGLVLAGLGVRDGLAVFSGQATNAANTFTTASSFGGDTGWLDPSAEAAGSGGDGDGFEVNPTYSFADDGGKVYWTDEGSDKVQRANLDGSGVEDLVTSGLVFPRHMALDVSGGKMYWTDSNTGKIQRANLDGSTVEDLVDTGLFYVPIGVALDVDAGKMYWTQAFDGIRRANLNGSGAEGVLAGLSFPMGIALDVDAGKMYWTDNGTDKIQRANMDGSGLEDLVTGLSYPDGIALDVAAGKMYWTDSDSNKIQRANLDGSSVEDVVATGLDFPIGIALDVGAGKMYWADGGTSKIQRANLDGSGVEDLISSGLVGPAGIAVDYGSAINNNGAGDSHLYYDYGISVSPECSISGIEVRLDWWLDSTLGSSSMSVELSWDGGASWTAAKTDSTESTSEHTVVLGGSSDTWGTTWSVAELGNANLRVRVTSNSDSSLRDFFLDWVPVRVTYTPP